METFFWDAGCTTTQLIVDKQADKLMSESSEHSNINKRISSCKSLFCFDNKSKLFSTSQKKSFSLQKFRAESVSSSSDSISAPLLGKSDYLAIVILISNVVTDDHIDL